MDSRASNRYMLKTTAVIAVGQMCTKAINFLLLPLYTALITTEVYGTVDLLSTVTSLLVVVVNLQLDQTIFRFVSTRRGNHDATSEVLTTVYALSAALCTIYATLFLVFSQFIPIQSKWYLLVGVLGSVFLATMTSTARGLGHNTTYALAHFLSAASIILLNLLILVAFRLPAITILCAYAAGPFIGGLTALLREKPWRFVDWRLLSKDKAGELLAYSIPLVPNELSWWVVRTSDRVIISAMLGLATNGLLAVADRFTAIYSTVFGIFNMAWVEQCFLHYEQDGGKEYLAQTMAQALKLFACGTQLLISLIPLLYSIMVDESYSEGLGLVAPYLFAGFLNVIVGLISPIYLVNKETKLVARTTLMAALINSISNPLLVLGIGVYAGPVSSIIGYLFIVWQRIRDINKRHMRLPFEWTFFARFSLASLAVLLAYYSGRLVFQIAGIAVAALYSWFECKSFAKSMITMVMSRGGKESS